MLTVNDLEKRKIMVLNFELHFPTIFNYDGKTGIKHITAKKFSTTAYGGKYIVAVQGQHPNKILVAGVNAGVELLNFDNWHEVSLDINTDETWYFSEQIPNDFSNVNVLSFCSDKGSRCNFNVKTGAIDRIRASTITLNESEKIIKTNIYSFDSAYLYFCLTNQRLFIWHNKFPCSVVPDNIIEFEENYGEPVAVGINYMRTNKFSVFFKKNLVRYVWSFSESSVFTVTKENEQNFGTKTLVNVDTFLPYYWNRYNIMLFDDGGIWGDFANSDSIVRITAPATEQGQKIIATKNAMARVDDDQSFMIYTYMYDSAPDAKRFLYIKQNDSGTYRMFSWKNKDIISIEGDSTLIGAEPAHFINGTCPADAPFAIWGDSNGGVYIMTEISRAATLSYCTNDTTSPHTYTDLYPHIRLESILDYELAGAEFQVYTTSSSAKAVRTSDGKTLTASTVNGVATIGNVGYGTWTVTAGSNTVTIEVKEFKQYKVFATLNDYSWAEISAASASGDAANLFSVGDTKSIILNGTVGNTTFSNLSIDAYILGINHNAEVEGNNRIHFCIGKVNSKTVGLIDSRYNEFPVTDSGYFTMNYSSDTNIVGWNDCYMRNSVMQWIKSTLSTDLQNVLKTVTKYTDNTGGDSNSSSNVTATTETICLEAEFEVHGVRTFANSYEQNKQQQYDYYKNGNSKLRYKYNSTSDVVWWWNRSPYISASEVFCAVNTYGTPAGRTSQHCRAVAPCFYV